MGAKSADELILATFSAGTGAIRFWGKVRKGQGEDACWIWTGATAGRGYGVIMAGSRLDGSRRMVYAHRVSLVLAHPDTRLDEQLGLHNCPSGDNPSCVNPRHLWSGSQQANMSDAAAKGRTARGRKRAESSVRRGERHHNAKLTDNIVREMRRRYSNGGVSQSQLGREFGIQQGAVSQIIRGQKWGHVS